MLRFYPRMRPPTRAAFDELMSTDPALMVIGSADEWVTQREALWGVLRLRSQGLEPGTELLAYESGDLGWFDDRPDSGFPDGSRMHTRFTAVLAPRAGRLEVRPLALSVGVPDDAAVALQRA